MFSVRSADPAMSPGMRSAVALIAALTARRVAMASPALNVGSEVSHPATAPPRWAASHERRSPVQASNRACHCSRRWRPRVVEDR